MKTSIFTGLMTGLIVFFMVGALNAATITNGFTYAVASGSDQSVGNHYHSNTGGSFGNPAGLAEVGNFYSEEVRGLSEYDLAGLSTASDAFFTFDVYGTGLFSGANNFAFDGIIDVVAYAGNNLENISDYQAASIGSIGSFSTAGIAVGDIFSFNITGLFNDAITDELASLGIRLQTEDTVYGGGAWVFNDFRLTNTDDSTGPDPVPEPGTILLLGSGLAGLAWYRRKRRYL